MTYSLDVNRCGLSANQLAWFLLVPGDKGVGALPSIVVIAVNVEDLLALDGEHSIILVSYSLRKGIFCIYTPRKDTFGQTCQLLALITLKV